MWISGGEHDLSENIVHMVLAKVADSRSGPLPAGVKGISLFVVPKFRPDGTKNDINLGGLNKKMGWRGTTNCVLNYGESQACEGELLGEEGKGRYFRVILFLNRTVLCYRMLFFPGKNPIM
jgi:alkylation response protein AidB-like acyl-CoA dehydrogenase